MSAKRYRPETQARALLRLVASHADPAHPEAERREHRRARAVVQAIADRRPFGVQSDPYRVRARSALRCLRKVADVALDAFVLECAAVDALECQAMHAAMERLAPVQGPRWRPPPSTEPSLRDTARLQAAIGQVAPDPAVDEFFPDRPGAIDNVRLMRDYDRPTGQREETA